jgi:hypothetical protein
VEQFGRRGTFYCKLFATTRPGPANASDLQQLTRFCKYFAGRGTFFSSWNIFFIKKRFDSVFFAVILRALFVEHFFQRGTF